MFDSSNATFPSSLIPIDTFDGIDDDSVESVKVLGHTARRKVEGLS